MISEHRVLAEMLDRDVRLGQRAGDVEEEPAGHDDRPLAGDLGVDRRAKRELHVGGGELEPFGGRGELDAAEHEHRRAGRESTCDDGDALGEALARNGGFQHIEGHGF